MENNLVSIIIPVYNDDLYLKECLDSCLAQVYQNIEIICVNDASTDRSLQILQSYKQKYNNIQVITYSQNRGVSYTRNRGLESANGKYIYFLDSDDFIKENAINDLYSYAEKHATDCVYFNSQLYTELEGIGAPCLEFGLHDVEEKIFEGPRLFQLLMERGVYSGSVCRQFWRRDYLLENNLWFEEGRLAEDALFSVKAILVGKRMMVINKAYHVYRRRGNSMSTNKSKDKAVSVFKIYCQLLSIWSGQQYSEDVNKAIKKFLKRLLTKSKRLYMRNKEKINDKDFEEGYERHLYNAILGREELFCELDADTLVRMRESDKLILYGAGEYAVDVIDFLYRHGINISCIAVTVQHENVTSINDIPLFEIDELVEMRNKSIVVLGVGERNRKDVIDNLNRLGFHDYVILKENVFT